MDVRSRKITLPVLAALLCVGCAQLQAPKKPAPAGPPRVEVLVDERPADPQLLEQHLERRRAEGASPEEIAELEALIESARAWAELEGRRIKVAPEKADALRAALKGGAAATAAQARQVLAGTTEDDAIAEIVGTEESLEPETSVSPQAKPAFEDRILDAARRADDASLDQILIEIADGDWAFLSMEATWALARRLAAANRFSEAADRLARHLHPLEHSPSRGHLWLSRGQWLLAAERFEEAERSLSRVIDEYDRTAELVRDAEELLRRLRERQSAQAREMLARIVEAESILRDGKDYVRAHDLAQSVAKEFRGTELAREASALSDAIIRQSEQRATLEINSLWNQFDLGLSLQAVEEELRKLAEISPGDYEQALIARAIEEFRDAEIDRKAGELRSRDQRIAEKWDAAQSAEAEGRYEDALALYRSLVDSPRKDAALLKISAVVDQMARSQREQAAVLFERALAQEDAGARKKALEAVEKTLDNLLVRFEAFSDRDRVERDLQLVREELEKVERELAPEDEAPAESMEPPSFNDAEQEPAEDQSEESPTDTPAPTPAADDAPDTTVAPEAPPESEE